MKRTLHVDLFVFQHRQIQLNLDHVLHQLKIVKYIIQLYHHPTKVYRKVIKLQRYLFLPVIKHSFLCDAVQ
jgi:hypothetical protein